jgi:hypothetical protein
MCDESGKNVAPVPPPVSTGMGSYGSGMVRHAWHMAWLGVRMSGCPDEVGAHRSVVDIILHLLFLDMSRIRDVNMKVRPSIKNGAKKRSNIFFETRLEWHEAGRGYDNTV